MADAPSTELPSERLNLPYHVIIGVAIGLVSLITVFAWPFAILTGMVIGGSEVDRLNGTPKRASFLVLAVTGGVLAMIVFGALIGGLFAFLIIPLAAFSERVAGKTSTTDRAMARLLLSIVAAGTWILLALVLHLNVNISVGGFNPVFGV